MNDALTQGELADLYDNAHNSRKARTLPMEMIFEWVDADRGCIMLKDLETLLARMG